MIKVEEIDKGRYMVEVSGDELQVLLTVAIEQCFVPQYVLWGLIHGCLRLDDDNILLKG